MNVGVSQFVNYAIQNRILFAVRMVRAAGWLHA